MASYTISELASQLSLSPSTIRRYVKQGTLPGRTERIGGRTVYRIEIPDGSASVDSARASDRTGGALPPGGQASSAAVDLLRLLAVRQRVAASAEARVAELEGQLAALQAESGVGGFRARIAQRAFRDRGKSEQDPSSEDGQEADLPEVTSSTSGDDEPEPYPLRALDWRERLFGRRVAEQPSRGGALTLAEALENPLPTREGELVELDSVRHSLRKVEWWSHGSYVDPEYGYLTFDVEVEGPGSPAGWGNPFDYRLRDPYGVEYQSLLLREPGLGSAEEASPDAAVRGWITFWVPRHVRSFDLVYAPPSSPTALVYRINSG